MRDSWLTPHWRGRRRIDHPVAWARLPEFDIGVAYVQTRVAHGHENRWFLYIRRFNDADVQAIPVLAQTVITSSAGSTQTLTSDSTWNNSNNSIEVIGAGARGARGASTSTSGGGGGGGAYSKIVNASITTPGTTPYYARVGGITATDGSVGGDSWWTLTSPGTAFPTTGTAVGAKGGAALASATSATGGNGGASASAYTSPSTSAVTSSGGKGGNAGASNASGGGGGGAGGAAGAGGAPGTGPSAGGVGNVSTGNLGGTGGAAGNPGVAGGAGTNLSTSPNTGSGGGGGGGNASASTGGQGGLYGGGGGGGGRSTGVGGQGRQGVVVLTWTLPPVTGTVTGYEGTPYELLLHMEGADAATTFADSGGKAQTVTAHGAAQIDTGQSAFVGGALMGASADDYVSADTGDFAFGTGDFTVDFRARLSSGSVAQVFYEGGPSGFKIFYDGAALKFKSAAGTITGSALAADTNYHIAVTCASGSTRLWLNGVQQGSTLADATNYASTAGYPRIGAAGEDAATTAWVAAVGSGNVSSPRRALINTLIAGLRDDGIWTKLDRLWIYAAENSASALVDLKGLVACTPVSAPSFSADDGYSGNGTSSYINTEFNPTANGVNYTQNSACFGVWDTTTSGAVGQVPIGLNYFGHLADGTINFTDGLSYWRVNSSSATLSVTYPGPGLHIANRSAASGTNSSQLYRNGSSIDTDNGSSTNFAATKFYVLARNTDSGTPTAGFFCTDQIAAVVFGGSLDATEQSNLYTRLRTYMTAVGVP